jgi:predicted HTH transcriptional regulator
LRAIKKTILWLFSAYFKKDFGQTYEEKGLTLEAALAAKKVIRDNQLTLAGFLFFGIEPQGFRPAFCIKTVSFLGNDMGSTQYRSKPEDITGPIPVMYKQ